MTSNESPVSKFTSCEISDALVKLGVPSGGHIPDVTMFSPSRDADNVKICGPAYTVKMVHASDKTSPKPSAHFVDSAPEGSVMLISAPPRELRFLHHLYLAFEVDYQTVKPVFNCALLDFGQNRNRQSGVVS